MGQVVQGLVSHGEDLGFYPEGGGIPEGLWAEEGEDLTRVLTGALWRLLRRGQTVGCEGRSQGTKMEAVGR